MTPLDLPALRAAQWRPVVGYEGLYEVSDRGRVRSLMIKRGQRAHVRAEPKMLPGSRSRKGYYQVSLRRDFGDRKGSMKKVHRLVLAAFRGPCPEDMEGAHLNGNPGDNRLENLVWTTHAENNSHRDAHGTMLRGSAVRQSLLDERMVAAIRGLKKRGVSQRVMADSFGVSETTISDILVGRRWVHVA